MPPLFSTCTRTLRKDFMMFFTTVFALRVRSKSRTRLCNAAFSIGSRFILRSFKSMARRRRRTQLQYFSTGFRSGDRGGMCQSVIRFFAWMLLAAGALRKDSLSHGTRNGPERLPDASLHAWMKLPALTASVHSVVFLHRAFRPGRVWRESPSCMSKESSDPAVGSQCCSPPPAQQAGQKK